MTRGRANDNPRGGAPDRPARGGGSAGGSGGGKRSWRTVVPAVNEDGRTNLAHLARRVLTPCMVVAFLTAGLVGDWVAELPNPVASHFAWDGVPDGFSDPRVFVGLMTVLLVLLPAAQVLLTVAAGVYTTSSRFVLALGAGIEALLAATLFGATGVQRGLTDATAARLPWWVLPVAFAAGAVATAATYRLLPDPTGADLRTPSHPVRKVRIRPGEHPVWTAAISVGPLLRIVLGLLVVLGVALLFASATAVAAYAVLAAVVLGLMMTTFRITVDQRGLTWRSTAGLPRGTVPLGDITAVQLIDVEPMAYGGWGLRMGPGYLALVMRRGPGIEVTRSSGKRVVITVDDAAAAVGLLDALRAAR